MDGRDEIFRRVREVYSEIERERNNAIEQRDQSSGESYGTRSGRGTRNKTSKVFRQNQERRKRIPDVRKPGKDYSFGSVPVVSHQLIKDRIFQHPSNKQIRNYRQTLKQIEDEQGLIQNYENDMEMPTIRPPAIGNGVDQFGSYTTLMGTEALFPITVRPKSTANIGDNSYTEKGDIVAVLPISPDFLTNTRLRLLLSNYQRWKPQHMSVTFQPLGNATLSGGLVAVAVTDPDTQLSLNGDSQFVVSRAMDFEGAVNFNAYNSVVVPFPKLPEEEEPYFMQAGISARFETPYTFWVIAQTTFPYEDDTDTERDTHWLTLNYEVRMYDPALPEISADNFTSYDNMDTSLFSDVFETSTAALNQPVRGMAARWTLGSDAREKIGIARVVQDLYDGGPTTILKWNCDTHGDFDLTKGTVFFYRRVWETSIPGSRIAFYSTIDGAYNQNDEMYWAAAPATAGVMSGAVYLEVYDLDHTV